MPALFTAKSPAEPDSKLTLLSAFLTIDATRPIADREKALFAHNTCGSAVRNTRLAEDLNLKQWFEYLKRHLEVSQMESCMHVLMLKNEKRALCYMKKVILRASLAILLIVSVAINAYSAPIDGDISFAGAVTPNNTNFLTATALDFGLILVFSASGQYSGMVGTQVVLTDFAYDPPAISVTPLWLLVAAPGWTFNATSMDVFDRQANHVDISGTGIAYIPGFDPTPGTYIITANSSGATYSFSASSGAHAVPEPLTLLLLGIGLVGVAGVRRL